MTPSTADRCPKCKSQDLTRYGSHGDGHYDAMGCDECDYSGPESEFWPTREELGLSATNCEACGRRLSWGCGHTHEHELAALAHNDTTEHLLGDCECFVSRPGYAARFTRDEWRERVACVVKRVRDDEAYTDALEKLLYP